MLAAVELVLAAVTVVTSSRAACSCSRASSVGLAAGWYGLVRRGAARVAGLGAAVVLGACRRAAPRRPRDPLITVVDRRRAVAGARRRPGGVPDARRPPRRAAAPQRPVLFYNPRSGGGKATRFDAGRARRARAASSRSSSPRATDLETLVRDAVARGADGLAMAGGDGSQAVVAAIAAEHGLAYACIPAGTRNHFALDLGVDRDDVVGALDAFVDGGERVVDLADVNGRIFVNNVSLGLYAEAVQRQGYREAKLRTMLDMVPGRPRARAAEGLDLHVGRAGRPRARRRRRDPRLEQPLPPRPRGRVGDAPAHRRRPARHHGRSARRAAGRGRARIAAPVARVDRRRRSRSAATVPCAAGIDGEATRLEPPLRFRIHPAALRVRIARAHPGASPSAMQPEGLWDGVRALAGLAVGRDPRRPPPRAVASPPAAPELPPPSTPDASPPGT